MSNLNWTVVPNVTILAHILEPALNKAVLHTRCCGAQVGLLAEHGLKVLGVGKT